MIVDPSEVLTLIGLHDGATDAQRVVCQMSLRSAEGAVKKYLQYNPAQLERTEYYPRSDRNSGAGGVWQANESQAYWERESGRSGVELQVQHLPIRSISAIYVDVDGRFGQKSGAFASGTQKTAGTDYWMTYDGNDSTGTGYCGDGIIRSFGIWPTEPGSIKIVYTAGYTPEELRGQDDILDASPIWSTIIDETIRRMKQAAARQYSSRGGLATGPKISESAGDYSYSTDASIYAKLIDGDRDLLPESKYKLRGFMNMGIMLSS